jgi:membrane-associated protein
MRALVPALAGTTGMPYRRFLVFNAVRGIVWATAVALGGYLAGASSERVQGVLGAVTAVTVAVAVLGGLTLAIVRHAKRLRALGRRYARQIVAATAVTALPAAGTGQFVAYR